MLEEGNADVIIQLRKMATSQHKVVVSFIFYGFMGRK